MLPGTFPDKVAHDTDCTDEAVVWCDVPVVEIFHRWLCLQMITNKYWCEYLTYCFWN